MEQRSKLQSARWHDRELGAITHSQWILVVEAFTMSMRIECVTKFSQEINISPCFIVVSRVFVVNVKSIKSIVLEYLD